MHKNCNALLSATWEMENKLVSIRICIHIANNGNLSLYVAKFTNNEMSDISTYFPIITSEH